MTFNEALWLLEYSRRTSPKAAAENNNKSGCDYIRQCFSGIREHLDIDEQKEIMAWMLSFVKAEKAV